MRRRHEATVDASHSAGAGPLPSQRPASALLELLPHFLDTVRREPAIAITLTYGLVAMAGIFYDVSFYRKFDIPVLSLAQLSDFLTAGIQQPVALVLVATTFPVCWAFDQISVRYRRRQRRKLDALRQVQQPTPYQRLRRSYVGWRVEQVWFTRLSYLAVVVAYGWTFVGSYADYRADAAKNGGTTEVRIWLNGEGAALTGLNSDRWTYLGAISSYVFVYDRAAAKALVVPVNAIARIEPFPAPAKILGSGCAEALIPLVFAPLLAGNPVEGLASPRCGRLPSGNPSARYPQGRQHASLRDRVSGPP